MIVLDTSAATDFLVPFEAGGWVAERLLADDDVHAPHALDVEILNALRGLVAAGRVPAATARAAIESLSDLDLTRYPHLPLLERMWTLRGTFTAYDAAFVALAQALDATLVTTDRRLARACRRHVSVIAP